MMQLRTIHVTMHVTIWHNSSVPAQLLHYYCIDGWSMQHAHKSNGVMLHESLVITWPCTWLHGYA